MRLISNKIRHCEEAEPTKQSRAARAIVAGLPRSLRSLAMTAVLVCCFVFPAQAEVFFWQDAETRMSVSFPDTWRRVHNQKADDVLTVFAPGVGDQASCRLRAREDKRFVIYPARYAANVQGRFVSTDFWQDYLGEFSGGLLLSVRDDAGLGRGFSSVADMRVNVPAHAPKRVLAVAGLYNDHLYIFECSAVEAAFPRWQASFLNTLKSVDFQKVIHEFPSGHYRNFLRDGKLRISGERREDVTYY